VICSFRDKETEKIFNGEESSKFPKGIQLNALMKMVALHFAENMSDVRAVDPQHFKTLHSDFHTYQIRVNDTYRIRFNIVETESEGDEETDSSSLEIIDVQLGDFH